MKTNDEIKQMPLVIEMHDMAKAQGVEVSLQDAYQTALENNLIDEQGNPTKWAKDNGMIAEVNLNDFSHLDYPNFIGNLYDAYVDEQSLTSEPIMSNRDFYEMMLHRNIVYPNGLPTAKAPKASLDDCMPSEELQAEMNIEEFIKACEPLQKYDAKHIRKVGNSFGFDLSVTYDLAKRVVDGDLGGDIDNCKDVMKQLKEHFGNDIEPL